MAKVREVCEERRLTLISVLPPATGSVFLAHVRNVAGQDLLLKRGNGIRGHFDGPVSAAWAADPASPSHVEQFDPSTFVREWIDGEPLDTDRERLPDRLRDVGRAMRRLHATTPPTALPDVRARFSPEGVLDEWQAALPRAMLERAAALGAQLSEYQPAAPALVHGDLVSGNVLVRADGAVAIIDPVGFVGMPARDLAQLAVATQGRDRRRNLVDVLEGYGGRPPLTDEVFVWLTFMFLEKNIGLERAHPGSRVSFVKELTDLAESLMAAG
jgi:Phosphotransferase enzyme family